MATMHIETLANDFVEIIAQQVSRELEERLAALEAKTHHFTFNKLYDLQAEVQGLSECNAANLQVMRNQQEKINHLETLLARIEVTSVTPTMVDHMLQERVDDRIKSWAYENLSEEVSSILDRIDLDYKIERAIGECDFDYAIKDVVYERIDHELKNKGFIDEEDLQTFLSQHQYLNEYEIIDLLNDRVRITVE